MNLGELRRAIRDLPDSTELVVHGGDGEHSEIYLEYRLPPDGAGHGWALSFVEGQPVTLELNMDERRERAAPWPDFPVVPTIHLEECDPADHAEWEATTYSEATARGAHRCAVARAAAELSPDEPVWLERPA